MKLIEPMPITDTEFVSSNVAETDEAEFDISTTYAASALVMVTTTNVHKIYLSAVSSNLGNQPESDDGSNWIEQSATERWMAFDGVLGDTVTNATSITYSIVPSEYVTGLAFFGLSAGSVRVQITDDASPGVEIYDVTKDMTDTTEVVDWFSFYFEEVIYDTEALFIGIPGWTGYTIDITISVTSGTAEVSQIVLGQVRELGESISGTSIGIQDYSAKSRDSFGNSTIVERAFADEASFSFTLNTDDSRRIKRILARLRATPAVYFSHEDLIYQGALVYGFYSDFTIPLIAGQVSFASLEIEGLT